MPWRHAKITVKTRYLCPELYPALFRWPKDQPPLDVDISTLDNPRALYYYHRGYRTHYRARTGDAARRRLR